MERVTLTGSEINQTQTSLVSFPSICREQKNDMIVELELLCKGKGISEMGEGYKKKMI